MTILATPTALSQLSVPGIGFNCCGEAQVASIVTDSGRPVTVLDVANVARAHGWAQASGVTSGAGLVSLLAYYGIPSRWQAGVPLSSEIPGALSRLHRCIVVVSSDGDGNPELGTGINHWLGVYGDNAGYQVMNSLSTPPGTNRTYGAALLQECDKRTYVEVLLILPKDRPKPDPPPPISEDAMSVIVIPAGEPFFVSGPDENTEWNAISAYGDPSSIEVIAYSYETGQPIKSVGPLDLTGNVAGVAGPIPQYGSVSALFNGPCSLGFVAGTGPVTLRLKLVD